MARAAQLYENIKEGRDVRQNLISLKQNIADESLRRSFMYSLGGDFSVLEELLSDEDPKVRKNAALILGMTEDEDVLTPLMEAYAKEETLFVREDYLKAVAMLDYRALLPQLNGRIEEISEQLAEADGLDSENPMWDNRRHLESELGRLRAMVRRYDKKTRHRFRRMNPAPDLILMTNLLHPDITAAQITQGEKKILRTGVHVKGGDLDEILKIRTFSECLFTIPGSRPIEGVSERGVAQRLHDLKIGNFLRYLHEEDEAPFRYRIELKARTIQDKKKGSWIHRVADTLDSLEKGKLQNTDSDYEAELRLIERRDGTFIPMLRLFTLPDKRFFYRRKSTAQSMAPVMAATAVELARDYLKEGAQVLDPFCGAGVLLCERCIAAAADPVYGTDTLGEAIEAARANTAALKAASFAGRGWDIHYINRDFFDFTHDYLFDEIMTELPRVDGSEAESFMERFLDRASGLLKEEAVLVVITEHPAALARAAAAASGYMKVKEEVLNERSGMTEFILRKVCYV